MQPTVPNELGCESMLVEEPSGVSEDALSSVSSARSLSPSWLFRDGHRWWSVCSRELNEPCSILQALLALQLTGKSPSARRAGDVSSFSVT